MSNNVQVTIIKPHDEVGFGGGLGFDPTSIECLLGKPMTTRHFFN
jgi:hypothetical protein